MARKPHPGAVGSARDLISTLRIERPSEIDVELIAGYLGILVKRRELAQEEGHLLRAGDNGLIVVSERAYQSAKWRFVIAHEIGHFIRHRDTDDLCLCTDRDLRDFQSGGREAESNDFASELLMPSVFFEKRCDIGKPSFRDIDKLVNEFGASLTATALRFVQFSPEPCAVVHSTRGTVDWVSWSSDFRIGIKRGTRLTTRTYAGDLFGGTPADDRIQQVDGDAWSDSGWASSIDLFEHSRKVASDSVLTFLWHPYR